MAGFLPADEAEIGFPLLRGEPAAFVPPPPRARSGGLGDWRELAFAQAPEETQGDELEADRQVQRAQLVFKRFALRFFDARGAVRARLDGVEPARAGAAPVRAPRAG